MGEIKKNSITWVTLIVLIVLGTFFAENGMENAVYLIVVISAIKFLLVTFQFVEVKEAHLAWKVLSAVFVAIFVIGVFVLY